VKLDVSHFCSQQCISSLLIADESLNACVQFRLNFWTLWPSLGRYGCEVKE
jgi:hypothetical protein